MSKKSPFTKCAEATKWSHGMPHARASFEQPTW